MIGHVQRGSSGRELRGAGFFRRPLSGAPLLSRAATARGRYPQAVFPISGGPLSIPQNVALFGCVVFCATVQGDIEHTLGHLYPLPPRFVPHALTLSACVEILCCLWIEGNVDFWCKSRAAHPLVIGEYGFHLTPPLVDLARFGFDEFATSDKQFGNASVVLFAGVNMGGSASVESAVCEFVENHYAAIRDFVAERFDRFARHGRLLYSLFALDDLTIAWGIIVVNKKFTEMHKKEKQDFSARKS